MISCNKLQLLQFYKIVEAVAPRANICSRVEIQHISVHYRINSDRYLLKFLETRIGHRCVRYYRGFPRSLASAKARAAKREGSGSIDRARHHRHIAAPAGAREIPKPKISRVRAAGDAASLACLPACLPPACVPACLPACPGYSLSAGRYRSFPEG